MVQKDYIGQPGFKQDRILTNQVEYKLEKYGVLHVVVGRF